MTTSIGDLALKIGVNSVDFGGGLKTAAAELEKFTAKGQNDVDSLATSFKFLKDVAAGIYAGMGQQNAKVQEQADLWSKIEDTLADVAVGYLLAQVPLLGIFATTEKVASATQSWGGDLDHITDRLAGIYALSRTLGETTENTQITLRAFERGGLSDEDARRTAQRFFQRVGGARTSLEAGSADGTAHALNQIGLDARDLAGSGFSHASEQVITSLGKLDDKWRQNEISMQIFGKSYQELEELIRRSGTIFNDARKDIAAFGQTDDVINMAQETRLAWKTLSNDWQREVTGPIGAAWQQLYANLDNWNAKFFKDLDEGLTWLERKVSEASVAPNLDDIHAQMKREMEAEGKTDSNLYRFITRNDRNATVAPSTHRTDGTPWYGPNARVDRMGNLLPDDDLYHQYTDVLLPRRDGETYEEQRARTQSEIISAGAGIGVTGPDGKRYGPNNQREQVERLRHLNPGAFDPGSMADPSATGINEAYAGNLAMREDYSKRIRTFGQSAGEIRLDDLRQQLTGPLSDDKRAAVEAEIDATRKVIMKFEELTRATGSMNRGFDIVAQAFDTSLGSAGVAIADFNQRMGDFNNAVLSGMGGDEEAQRRMVATDAFLRLERATDLHIGLAGPVNAESSEAIRVVANARRQITTTDPQVRMEQVLRRANEQRDQQIRAFEKLADAVQANGLAVARIS